MQVLLTEQDLSTKRNAFLMLCHHSQDRAIAYLLSQLDSVAMWGDILQMAVLELIRKVLPCHHLVHCLIMYARRSSGSTCIAGRCRARRYLGGAGNLRLSEAVQGSPPRVGRLPIMGNPRALSLAVFTSSCIHI
jgi:hypothetical protein